jgi:cell shape-determining protein MreD
MAAVALVQVTLLATPLGFSAPLLLVLAICRTLLGVGSAFPDGGVMLGLRWALYGGLGLDICTATPLGSHALALLLAALAVAALTRSLQIAGPLLPLVAVLVGSPIC